MVVAAMVVAVTEVADGSGGGAEEAMEEAVALAGPAREVAAEEAMARATAVEGWVAVERVVRRAEAAEVALREVAMAVARGRWR